MGRVTPALSELLAMIDEAFDARAWHGPTLRRAVRGVTAAQAAWRPAPGRHNIWEIAVHAAYWKHQVRRRLGGRSRRPFPLAGENWFASNGRSWSNVVRLLVDEHKALRVASRPCSRPPRPRPRHRGVYDPRHRRARPVSRGTDSVAAAPAERPVRRTE